MVFVLDDQVEAKVLDIKYFLETYCLSKLYCIVSLIYGDGKVLWFSAQSIIFQVSIDIC